MSGSLSPPKYRRHKASGQAVVTLNGQDHYLGKWRSTASREAYRRLTAEWLLNGGRPTQRDDHDTTVVEIIAAFMQHARAYYVKAGKPTSEVVMLKRVLGIVKELYGRERAADFGPLALKTCRQRMIECNWCRTQINKHTDRIKRMFKWAVSEELLPSHVYEALRTVTGLRKGRSKARESSPVMPVDDATIEATIEHLSDTIRDMVLLQRYCGARPSEICNLRPCDVDRSGDVWEYIPAEHKMEHRGRQRVIYLGPRAQRVLMPYLLRASSDHCFVPAESERKRRDEQHAKRQTPASCGNRPGTNRQRNSKRRPGGKYDVCSYGSAIRRAAKKAGVSVWSPGRLRHNTASEIRKSHGLEGSQVILGHANARTSEIYAERDSLLAIRIASEVG